MESNLKIPKFTPTQSSRGNDDICPVCKGSGWELYQPHPSELEYVYGDSGITVDYARPCTRCKGFVKYQEDLTNVPDAYRSADITKFSFDVYSISEEVKTKMSKLANNIVFDFPKWRSHGFGLYIYGTTPGSGKTFLACSIAKSIMVKYECVFRFTTAIDYIKAFQMGIENRKNNIFDDPSDKYRACDLLVFDDIGAQKDSEFNRERIIDLVDYRTRNGLITIYTSNLSINELALDDRTKSRITNTTVPFPMPEESIRQRKAVSKQKEFLKGLNDD